MQDILSEGEIVMCSNTQTRGSGGTLPQEITTSETTFTSKMDKTLVFLTKFTYCIAGNFRGAQFSRMVDLYHFVGLILVDKRTHVHYVLYNPTYFAGLIFAVRQSSVKTTKIGPPKTSCYMVIHIAIRSIMALCLQHIHEEAL